MPVQHQARAQLAALRQRLQPANGDSWYEHPLDSLSLLVGLAPGASSSERAAGAGTAAAGANRPPAGPTMPGDAVPAPGQAKPSAASPASLTAELAPGQLTRADEIRLVRTWPLAKVRDLAEGQIKRSREALETASNVPWYTGLYIRWINHVRWGPSVKMLQDAEDSYAHAEKLSAEAEKKESYISAWTTARLALSAIAKEAQLGETDFIYLAKDLGHAAFEAAEPYLKQAGAGLELALWAALGLGLIKAVSK